MPPIYPKRRTVRTPGVIMPATFFKRRASDAPKDLVATPTQDLLHAFRSYLGRFFTLFGSAAAVVAFLVFAGFLSEFALYRLVGIPRLSFSPTSLIESGAEVLIDSLSLMLGSGSRLVAAIVGFGLVVWIWGQHEQEALRSFARSARVLRWCRLAVLAWAFVLLAGLISFVQHGLDPEGADLERGRKALAEAYSHTIPKPREVMRRVEALTYDVPWFRLPNWATAMLDDPVAAVGEDWVDAPQGMPTRVLPESREAARHVFGWLALSVLALATAGALLSRWRAWLDELGDERSTTTADKPAEGLGVRLAQWLALHPLHGIDGAMQFLVAPLTLLLTMAAIALLPIAHGLLARPSVGSEQVMLRLAPKAKGVGDEAIRMTTGAEGGTTGDHKPDSDSASSEGMGLLALKPCIGDREDLEAGRLNYFSKLAGVLHVRSSESEFEERMTAYRQATLAFAVAVADAQCEEALALLWTSRPPVGLSAVAPDVYAVFQIEAQTAFKRYPVAFGTILHYARDAEPLMLIDVAQARSGLGRSQWELRSFDRQSIAATMVVPDIGAIRDRSAVGSLRAKPDARKPVHELTSSPSIEALRGTLELIDARTLHANPNGVAVTSIGARAWVASSHRPDLTGWAVDLLIDLARADLSDRWPDKDDSLRGAAVTALSLTRSPYAASLLAAELTREGRQPCPPTDRVVARRPLRCIPQTVTSVGYLLADFSAEIRSFGGNVPARVQELRTSLTEFLIDRVVESRGSFDMQGAACSALTLSAVRRGDTTPEQRERFFAAIEDAPQDEQSALGLCINTMSQLGLGSRQHRDWLLARIAPNGANGDSVRRAALIALAEIGPTPDMEALLRAYAQWSPRDPVMDIVETLLSEIPSEPSARWLVQCADDSKLRSTWRLRCLRGLTLLDDDYDGDSGSSGRATRWIDGGGLPEGFQQTACTVLKEMVDRGGLWAERDWKHKKEQCKALGVDVNEEHLDAMKRLRELLTPDRRGEDGAAEAPVGFDSPAAGTPLPR